MVNFSKLPGAERILSYLKSGRVHSSLLIAGPFTPQRNVLVKAMCKILLCPEKGCGQCTVCRRVDKEIHPDVIRLGDPEEDSIKIENVREVCHQMEISPLEAHAKICVVDECHRMTIASANAFLKTLEEPREGRYFILLTSQPGSLLPTILSRCLRFSLRPAEETPSEDSPYTKVLDEYFQTRNLTALLATLSEKEKCLQFILLLQKVLRDKALAQSGEPAVYSVLEKFEGALQLEGRLRSNANYGLLLESYLKEHFSQ